MKDGVLKKVLIVIVVLLLIASVVFSVIQKRNKHPYRYSNVEITFNEEKPVVQSYEYEENDETPLISDIAIEVNSELTQGTQESHTLVEDFTGSGMVSDDNLQSVIEGLLKDDIDNFSQYPVTKKLYGVVLENNGLCDTISSGSELNFQMTGIASDNTFMSMFITQTSSYYVTGTIVGGMIDSLECKELR